MKYKDEEIGIPTLGQIQEYISEKGLIVTAKEVYKHFKDKNWETNKKTPIKSLEAMVNSWNGVKVARIRKTKKSNINNKIKNRNTKKCKIKNKNFVQIPYSEQLRNPKWKSFRERVFKVRGKKCERCKISTNLQIHHLKYKKKHYAWEYSTDEVLVLCNNCHKRIHGLDLDEEFYSITKH
jgi:hypothetical protein